MVFFSNFDIPILVARRNVEKANSINTLMEFNIDFYFELIWVFTVFKYRQVSVNADRYFSLGNIIFYYLLHLAVT